MMLLLITLVYITVVGTLIYTFLWVKESVTHKHVHCMTAIEKAFICSCISDVFCVIPKEIFEYFFLY